MFPSCIHKLLLLLVLVASGDDFNILRVAFPDAWEGAPTGSAEFDNPNTDFLPAGSRAPIYAEEPRSTGGVASTGFGHGCTGPSFLPLVAMHTPAQTPLRC